MKKVIFLHIEKSAGSSLRSMLYNSFGRNNIYWHGVDSHFVSPADFSVIGGHRPISYYEELGFDNCIYLAILREPSDRVVSLYNYYIQNSIEGMLLSSGFDSLSLENTLKNCQSFINVVENGQCLYVSGSRSFESSLNKINNNNFFIGTFENIKDYDIKLKEYLGITNQELPTENTGSQGYKEKLLISDSTKELLENITFEDYKLYNYVLKNESGVISTIQDSSWEEIKKTLSSLEAERDHYPGNINVLNVPEIMRCSTKENLSVTFVNNSESVWNNQKRNLKISYHWINLDGSLLEFEGMRTVIDLDVIEKGYYYPLTVAVLPPGRPGDYILQITLLKEGFAWLENKGFDPLELNVRVCS